MAAGQTAIVVQFGLQVVFGPGTGEVIGSHESVGKNPRNEQALVKKNSSGMARFRCLLLRCFCNGNTVLALLFCDPFLPIRSFKDQFKCVSVKGPYCYADGNRDGYRVLSYFEGFRTYLSANLLSKGTGLVKRVIGKNNDKLLTAIAVGSTAM